MSDKFFSGWSRKSEENWNAIFGPKEPEGFFNWCDENGVHLLDLQREYIKKVESGELTIEEYPNATLSI